MKSIITVFIVLISLLSINAQVSPQKYSKVRIDITSLEDIRHLRQSGLELDRFQFTENNIEAILSNKQIKILNTTARSYKILIDDMIEHYNQNVRMSDAEMISLQKKMQEEYEILGFKFGSMGGYYTNDEVLAELDSMRLLYPDLVSVKQSIGLSIDSLDIWMVRISDNPDFDEDEPEILYTSLIHADEPQSMATVMYFMYYLLENYGTDPFVTFLIENRELYFIPVWNPDGYVYNEQTNPTGGGMWRKNKRDNDENGVFDPDYDGVDLNRNFGYMWGYDNLGSSPDSSSIFYRGKASFSEPETQAIRELCINRNFQLAFLYHSSWRVLFQPWGYENILTPDSLIFIDLMSNMTQYNNYSWWNGGPEWGVFNGDCGDWMYGEQTEKNKIFAITIETGPGPGVLWPSQNQIYSMAEELLYSNLILALGPGVLDTDTTLQIQNTKISTGYLTPGIDTIFIQAGITNPDSLQVSVQTFIVSLDQSLVDTAEMFDDGSHNDSTTSDGIFGITSLAPSNEKHYSAHLYASSNAGNNHFLNNIGFFTTIGPVIYDGITFTGDDTVPNPGDRIRLELTLKNSGTVATATNVEAKIISSDALLSTYKYNRSFGDIAAGENSTSDNTYLINISEECPVNAQIPILIYITSDGIAFWNDIFNITVQEPTSIKDIIEPVTRIYPNPADNLLNIEISGAIKQLIEIEILTVTGSVIYKKEYKNTSAHFVERIDLSSYPEGIYFLRISNDQFSKVFKLLKVN